MAGHLLKIAPSTCSTRWRWARASCVPTRRSRFPQERR